METIEVKYFLEVSRTENIRKASEFIGISPSAISKAISRLEQELETKLIEKAGRNIILTSAGKKLAKTGAEFLAFEKQIVDGFSTQQKKMNLKIVGPELVLSHWGPQLMSKISKEFPNANLNFKVVTNGDALTMVDNFEADFALFSSKNKLSRNKNLFKKIDDMTFKVMGSKKHWGPKKIIAVEDIVKEKFALTNSSARSLLSNSDIYDGWRDDKFPRKNLIFTDSLKILDSVLQKGLAISYLPEFYGESLGLQQIKISGCPYSCSFSVYLCRNKYSISDLWNLF